MKNKSFIKSLIAVSLLLFFCLGTVKSASIILGISSKYKTDTYVTVEGQVIDKVTNNPLVFVSVSAVGSNVGTVTNTEGKFTLNIENDLNVSQISFKHLGYKNKIVPLSSLKAKNVTISMEAYVVPIEEVIIRPSNPYELIEEILRKIPENYCVEAYKHMAFYRETIKKRKKYVSISEAVVEIYKAPYDNEMKNDLVKLYKGRKSANVKSQDTLIMKLKGGPQTALLLDIAKNPYILFSDENLENYLFEIDEIANINDNQNYVIKFTQKTKQEYPLFNGKLYVEIKSLAITAAEFSLNLENEAEASKMFVRKKPLFMTITPIATNYVIKFTEYNGKYFFSHARGEVMFKVKWKKKLFNSKYTVMTEIASTDRTNKNVIKYPRNEQLKSSIVFEEKVHPFADPEFWGKYNTIKPEESIENAINKYGVRLKIQNN
ncbi:MAG: carboxypeptidase-like regulatory domain-containing protein [Bacteroidales bacterium]|nr:carboxypeptidase-like regulatory domain-containing protein [Bacteroidales bacterium]